MKILGLDASGLVAGVAILEDDILLAEYTTDYKKTHSQTLLPMLEEIRQMIELDLATIDAIAVAAGPGSFTGLRIGAATAKGLGLALDKPLVEVSTLEGMAYGLWGSDALVCPIMDARRNQVYTAVYRFVSKAADAKPQAVLDPCAMDVDELLAWLCERQEAVIFLGDGVAVYRDKVKAALGPLCSFAPAGKNRQRAANIAALGAIYLKEGKTVSAADHVPTYLRGTVQPKEG